MQRTTTNGLTTLWTEGPEPFTAALVLGMGGRDETYRTTGVGHLIEHLVMATLPKRALDRNATVDGTVTVFHATGRREAVTEFLVDVCTALRDLPLGRLETEARVLAAEEGNHEHPALGWAASTLYETEGIGLLGAPGVPPGQLTAEQVRDHLTRWVRADNAVLVCTSPPPDDPRITLPEGIGPRPVHPVARRSTLPLPAVISSPPVVVLGFHTPRDDTGLLLGDLLRERVEDEARHTLGLSYSVDIAGLPVGGDETLAALWSDAAPEHHATVAACAVQALRSLAMEGPNPDELQYAKDVALGRLQDPRGIPDLLVLDALRLLDDLPVRGITDRAVGLDAVTASQIQAAAQRAAAALLVGVEDSKGRGILDIPDRTQDRDDSAPPMSGTDYRRRMLSIRAPRDLVVTIGDDGIRMLADGFASAGSWSDVVGVARGPGVRMVVLRSGVILPVIAADLRSGDQALAEIDRRAVDVVYDDPEAFA